MTEPKEINRLFFDTETTGLDPLKNSIIQFGAYFQAGNTLSSIDWKMQPFSYENITDEALGKHGISVEQMKTFPEAKMVYEQIRGFLAANSQNGNKITLVGFNVKFDILMLEALFKHFDPQDSVFKFCSHKYIDVYEQIKMLKEIGYFPELKNLKLESFFEMFGEDPSGAHDALADVRVTYKIFNWLEQVYKKGTV